MPKYKQSHRLDDIIITVDNASQNALNQVEGGGKSNRVGGVGLRGVIADDSKRADVDSVVVEAFDNRAAGVDGVVKAIGSSQGAGVGSNVVAGVIEAFGKGGVMKALGSKGAVGLKGVAFGGMADEPFGNRAAGIAEAFDNEGFGVAEAFGNAAIGGGITAITREWSLGMNVMTASFWLASKSSMRSLACVSCLTVIHTSCSEPQLAQRIRYSMILFFERPMKRDRLRISCSISSSSSPSTMIAGGGGDRRSYGSVNVSVVGSSWATETTSWTFIFDGSCRR